MITPSTPINPLSDEQLNFFRANGFLHIPQLIPEAELEAARKDTEELIRRGLDEETDDSNYRYGADASDKNQKCLFRIDNLISHFGNDSFKMLLAYPPLLRAVRQAVGEEHFSSSVHSCVFKIPHRGYPVPWHQDPIEVFRFPVFNVDIYLDEATLDNGCLYVIPGSHLAGYHGADPEWIQSWTQGRAEDAPDAIAVPTRPGDVLFHATTVLHGSFWNRTDSLRRTIYFHIDHLQDVNLSPQEKRMEGYLAGQKLTAQGIELRRAQHPAEEAFDYKLV